MSRSNYFYYAVVILFFIGIMFYNFGYIENYKNNDTTEKKKDERYWGIDYHGSVQNDNYWIPQLNLHPSYIFYDSDYNET